MWKRVIAFAVTVAAAVGLFLGSATLPNRLIEVGDPGKNLTQSLDVKAKDLTLVCPGSAFTSGSSSNASATSNSFKRIGSATVDYSSDLPGGVTLSGKPLTGPASDGSNLANTAKQVSAVSTVSSFAITVNTQTQVVQQGSALATAQSFELGSTGGVAGALGANCQQPQAESWLIGGITLVGRQALLILANPAATDATVNLQLFGSNGLLVGSGLSGISVSANRTVILPLSGFAPDEAAITVHVTSMGAPVAAWIQESTVRGTAAAGADYISPSIPAAKVLAIPGLLKRGTADATALISANSDYQDLTPSVQVFVPGSSAATVTIQVIGSNSKSTGTVRQEQVPANSTMAIDLPGLGDGDYGVFVVSDHPVLAAVKLSRTKQGASPVTDFAWLSAVSPLSNLTAVVAPKSAISKLSILNGGSQSAAVSITNRSDGSVQQVKVPRLGSAVVAIPAGGVIGVSSDQPVSVTMIDDFTGQIVAIPFVDPKNVGGKLTVRAH